MLETLDLRKSLSKTAYAKLMPDLQERMRKLQYQLQEAGIPVIVCLEGWDLAGKGRVIKKLMEKLDPRLFHVHPGSKPTEIEAGHQFLWRYQVALPNDGEMSVFDHSWYGRVLVERCDKLVPARLWREAYQEMNEFERCLADDGQVIVKLWLHISKVQQRQRIRECQRDPLLRWKVTKEYRRQHRRYGRWLKAVEEMLARTDTTHAPWFVIEANDLRWARVSVFQKLVQSCEAALVRRAAARSAAGTAASQPGAAATTTSPVTGIAEFPAAKRKPISARKAKSSPITEAAHA